MTPHSSGSPSLKSGTLPAASYSVPLWMRRVTSPPSSTIWSGPAPLPKSRARSVHHQYSSRVSPFQAKTGTPAGFSTVPLGPTAMAAAAWSWVLKMLHEHQRTWAPRDERVSIRTAVWIVMWRLPTILRPLRGWALAYSARTAMRPGISCSARRISLRPQSARERSLTLNSRPAAAALGAPLPLVGLVSGFWRLALVIEAVGMIGVS